MRYLPLALALAACGAAAPTPGPTDDAGADVSTEAAACPVRHFLVAGRCVPGLNERCGDPPRACPAGQSCALVGGGTDAAVVRCDPD